MANFVPFEKYIDILNEVGRWKVITLKALHQLIGGNLSYSPFARRVRILENEKLLKGLTLSNNMKCLTLTHKGGKYSSFNGIYDENEDSLSHDLICSQVLRKLLRFENFLSGEIYQEKGSGPSPDAVIYAQRKELPYTLAIEIELHQKSKQRIVTKLSRYSRSEDFDFVLYLFNKESVFESYKRVVESLLPKVQERIVLGFSKELSEENINYQQENYWHKGEQKNFDQIFK